MSEPKRASDGALVYPDDSPVTYGYDASGNLITETIHQYGISYVKTYAYAAGVLVSETQWTPQP